MLKKDLEKKVIDLEGEKNYLEQQIRDLSKGRIMRQPFSGKHIKIGVISDTHSGSLYANPHLDSALVRTFNKEGCDLVYHIGDILDGEKMYRGHEYELEFHGADRQVRNFVNRFPHVKSKMYVITGNHDLSFWKHAGVDVGQKIVDKRDDIEYLGQDEAIIELKKNVKIMLIHPAGGTAYAVSYKSQKLIESFSGGKKPNIMLCGHYHKYDHLFFRNVQGFQVPTTQSQTPYMKRKPTPAIMGGLILDIWTDKKGISRLKAEYLPYYEK